MKSTLIVLLLASLFVGGQMKKEGEEKIAVIRGKVYRSDTNQPIANAEISFLDEKKSEKQDNSADTRADAEGNYTIRVREGRYTVAIRSGYKKQEDAPCQLLMGKTRDKNSMIMIMRDREIFYQQLFIKEFSVKAGKEINKDFDFVCKSLFEK
jgi:hypothetical protein